MKAMTIARVFPVILLASLLGTSAYTEEKDLAQVADDAETQIRSKFLEYDKDKDVKFLKEAHESVSDLYQYYRHKDYKMLADKILELRLLVLNKCFKERDYTYGFDNPPICYTNVAPPLWIAEHQMIIAGMPPEDVIDPKARKEYEEGIAENNRRRDKFAREHDLQYLVDSEIRYIEQYMYNIQREPERQNQMWKSIEANIESEDLRKKLREAFERTTEEYNKNRR